MNPPIYADRALRWAQRLQAISQTGLYYALNDFDRERFDEVRAIAAEMMAAQWGADPAAFHTMFSRDQGYATPKVDVRGAVFQDDRILLVQEREDGGWTLPGGWADLGQSAAQSVVREIREESGYETRAFKLLAVLERDRYPHPPIPFASFKMIFLCELVGGEAAASNETSAVGFFAQNEIPPLSLTRTLPRQIRMAFEHRAHPEWPTIFD